MRAAGAVTEVHERAAAVTPVVPAPAGVGAREGAAEAAASPALRGELARAD
jgi:hypothetical protein